MPSIFSWKRLFGEPFDRGRWRELLHSSGRPQRTAFAAALGAMVGATPILGVHTWAAVSLATLLRLPALTVLLGTNLSNPITFVPITLLEIRVGQGLLGLPGQVLPEDLTAAGLGEYVAAAWLGYLVVGPAMAVLTYLAVRLGMRTAKRPRRSAVLPADSAPSED